MASPVGRTRVDFGSAADIRVRVTFSHYASTFALACDAARARTQRGSGYAAELAACLPAKAHRALWPIVAPGHSLSPDCLSPGDPGRDATLAEELDRLGSLTGDDVRADLERTFADTGLPAHWRPVWASPREWVDGVVAAFDQIGRHLERAWRRSAAQREHEAQRIGTAVARGATDVALALSHPRGHLNGTCLVFPDAEPVELDAAGRCVVLTPMIGSPHTSVCNLDAPDTLWFGYPLPRALGDGGASGASAALDALLTPIRARLLRRLDRELPMHEVASLLMCSPATATYHCAQLVKAGLIERRQRGRIVNIARSSRGDSLLDTYSVAL
ncbi:winged helix-turn-helix domain-containing protein [Nocardiopsis halophila]|uniref:winged helix-turn-helix domain-containing protein n=1 Tax=Nocardiopsis halophila TaxID=141692 RepID=UPI0003461395|nr:winged helix-turn-helix domain-containing protein [Nocardiopsis halophila]